MPSAREVSCDGRRSQRRRADRLQLLFVLVTVMGFVAAKWRRAANANNLDEWGLGGRPFGTWVTWFLLGGDLYTAYTFVAVPAAIFAGGRSPGSSPCRIRSSSIR